MMGLYFLVCIIIVSKDIVVSAADSFLSPESRFHVHKTKHTPSLSVGDVATTEWRVTRVGRNLGSRDLIVRLSLTLAGSQTVMNDLPPFFCMEWEQQLMRSGRHTSWMQKDAKRCLEVVTTAIMASIAMLEKDIYFIPTTPDLHSDNEVEDELEIGIDENRMLWETMMGIDAFLYINLDNRRSRRRRVLAEFARLGLPSGRIERLRATQLPRPLNRDIDTAPIRKLLGFAGNAHSNMRALDVAIESGWDVVAIFEDDFSFAPNASHVRHQLREFHRLVPSAAWDVLVIAAGQGEVAHTTYGDFVKRAQGIIALPGFVVKGKRMIRALRDSFQGSYTALMDYFDSVTRGTTDEVKFADYKEIRPDHFWIPLQIESSWLMFWPPIGRQTPGFSSINSHFKNENCGCYNIVLKNAQRCFDFVAPSQSSRLLGQDGL